jgi:uncharacterized membrane protein
LNSWKALLTEKQATEDNIPALEEGLESLRRQLAAAQAKNKALKAELAEHQQQQQQPAAPTSASADVDTIREYLATGADTEFEHSSTGSLRSLGLRAKLQQTRVDPEMRQTEQSLRRKYARSEEKRKKKGGE